MADDQNATREFVDRLFQDAHCLDVEIVGWFVEQQQVSSSSQELSEVDTVSFASGANSNTTLLLRTSEIKARNVGATVYLNIAELNAVATTGNLFKDGIVVIELVSMLVYISELNSISEFDRSLVRRVVADNHSEERRFADPVRSNDADNGSAWNVK